MNNFETVLNKYANTLKQYVPIVERVHGPSHPEFYEVKKAYDNLINQISENDSDLDKSFKDLRTASNNYTVPSGVCETYEAVYNMLSELDAAYYI